MIQCGVPFSIETDSLESLGVGEQDSVIIFAANSDSEWVRANATAAREINITATTRLAVQALRLRAHLVFMSSEAVFGSSRQIGWTEECKPSPCTEYGRQKYEMEEILTDLGGSCIVRTGWNVSARPADRCVVKAIYTSLLKGGARLASDNIFSLTDVSDTARLLLKVVQQRAVGTVHSVSGFPVSRTIVADEIIQVSKMIKDARYEKIRHSDIYFKEPKPASAWLAASGAINSLVPIFATPKEIVSKKVAILEGESNWV